MTLRSQDVFLRVLPWMSPCNQYTWQVFTPNTQTTIPQCPHIWEVVQRSSKIARLRNCSKTVGRPMITGVDCNENWLANHKPHLQAQPSPWSRIAYLLMQPAALRCYLNSSTRNSWWPSHLNSTSKSSLQVRSMASDLEEQPLRHNDMHTEDCCTLEVAEKWCSRHTVASTVNIKYTLCAENPYHLGSALLTHLRIMNRRWEDVNLTHSLCAKTLHFVLGILAWFYTFKQIYCTSLQEEKEPNCRNASSNRRLHTALFKSSISFGFPARAQLVLL